VHELSSRNTRSHHRFGRRFTAPLAAALISCGTLSGETAELPLGPQTEQAPLPEANKSAAAADTGVAVASPQRWLCSNGWSVNVEYSGPRAILFACATLRDVIDEYNRYGTWHFIYSGPDSTEVLTGLLNPNYPPVTILEQSFRVKVQKRDPSSRTITLKPLEGRSPPPRRPAPRSLRVDRDWDGGRNDPHDCEDIQFDDGRAGMWCRHANLGGMLAAFSGHNEWQLSLVDAAMSERIADGLFAYDDLDGLLRYLKTYHLVVGSRALALHEIRLVRRGDN